MFSKLKKGFTLAEIVIAVALMATLIVIVLGVFVTGTNAIKKAKYRTTAINLADKKLIELRNLDISYFLTCKELYIISNIQKVEKGVNVRTASVSVSNDLEIIEFWKPDMSYKISGVENNKGMDYNFAIYIEDYKEDPNSGEYNGDPAFRDIKKVSAEVKWKELNGNKTIEIRTLLGNPNI